MDTSQKPVTQEGLEMALEKAFQSFGEDLIKIVATKEEVKGLVTQEQFENVATKADLADLVTTEELRETKDEILKSNDKVMTELQRVREEQVANTAAHDRFDEEIKGIKVHVGLSEA